MVDGMTVDGDIGRCVKEPYTVTSENSFHARQALSISGPHCQDTSASLLIDRIVTAIDLPRAVGTHIYLGHPLRHLCTSAYMLPLHSMIEIHIYIPLRLHRRTYPSLGNSALMIIVEPQISVIFSQPHCFLIDRHVSHESLLLQYPRITPHFFWPMAMIVFE
jgi:hypothetical protein